MSYTPETWVDRNVSQPNTYSEAVNGDGTKTFTASPGVVIEAGTTVSAEKMNNIEAGLVNAHAMTNIYAYRNLGGGL